MNLNISFFSIKHKFWMRKRNTFMRCFFFAPKICYYGQVLKQITNPVCPKLFPISKYFEKS